jgi:hypothetical protein
VARPRASLGRWEQLCRWITTGVGPRRCSLILMRAP